MNPLRAVAKILRFVGWTFVAAVGFVAAVEVFGLAQLLPESGLLAFKSNSVEGWRVPSEKATAEALSVGLGEDAGGMNPEAYAIRQSKLSPTTLQVDLWHWGIADFSLLSLRSHVEDDRVLIEPVWGTGASKADGPKPFCGCEQLHHVRIKVQDAPLQRYRVEVRERSAD